MKGLETVLASNIIELRTKAGMTQLELAEKLNYSDKSVSKWERAESTPDVFVLKNMADIFGVTVDYLITQHDPNEKKSRLTGSGLISRAIITWISMLGIWILALMIFIICWIAGSIRWLIFVYAIPVTLITLLVFHSIWEHGRFNFLIVAALIFSVILLIYLVFIDKNWWQLFLLVVPAEIEAALCFWLGRKVKEKSSGINEK